MSRLTDVDALIEDLEYDIKIDQDSLDYEDLSEINRSLIQTDKDIKQNAVDILKHAQTVNAVPVVRCKDCKHYELDSWAKINGIPLIVAHHICKRWGNGCKTDENGFCFMGEKVTE